MHHNLLNEVNGLLDIELPDGSRMRIGCDYRTPQGMAVYRRPTLDPRTLDINLSGGQWLVYDPHALCLPIEFRSARAARQAADDFAGYVSVRRADPTDRDAVDVWAREWINHNGGDGEYVGWPALRPDGGPATGGHVVVRDDPTVDTAGPAAAPDPRAAVEISPELRTLAAARAMRARQLVDGQGVHELDETTGE